MVYLGDVWAVTALIGGVALSAWAFLTCLALVFQRRSRDAMARIERRPAKLFFLGLVQAVFVGGFGVILFSSPQPGVKFLGILIILMVLGLSFVGSAGIVWLAGERIRILDPNCTPYGCIARGALFVVLPTILPVLGWFLIAPVIFCVGLGAASAGLSGKEPVVSLAA